MAMSPKHFDIVGATAIPPATKKKIVMGYERLRPGPAGIGPMGTGWVICNDHGTSRGALVKMGFTEAWCCKLCISQNCKVTTAERVGSPPPEEGEGEVSWGE
jgi:hypothetical protein